MVIVVDVQQELRNLNQRLERVEAQGGPKRCAAEISLDRAIKAAELLNLELDDLLVAMKTAD